MGLVAVLKAAQDPDGVIDGRFSHIDLLEPPFQCGVLLNVLPVLIQSRGADQAQFPPGEHGFEHIAGVHRTFRRAGSHDGMKFVDKGDNFPVGVADILKYRLESLLELPTVLGPGNHRPKIEADQRLSAQRLRHVAFDHPLGEAFHDGRLPDPRLPDKDRIVLGPSGQDLHQPPNLRVASDHGIELSSFRQLGQIHPELLQCLEGSFRIRTGHFSVSAQGRQGCGQCFPRGPGIPQRPADGTRIGGETEQQVLGGGKCVPQRICFLPRGGQCLQRGTGKLRWGHRGTGRGWQRFDRGARPDAELLGINSYRLEQCDRDAAALIQQCFEDMRRFDLRIAGRGGVHDGS